MAWMQKRADFQQRFDALADRNIDSIISKLNVEMGKYVSSAGLTQNQNASTNPEYVEIVRLANEAEELKQQYNTLNDDILRYLKEQSRYNDMPALLEESGTLQTTLTKLHEHKKEMKVDLESAIARDELLRSRNTKRDSHTLFLLDRPIRKPVIPYLWVLSILFIGLGLIMIKTTMPQLDIPMESTSYLYSIITNFISNRAVLLSIIVAAVIVIIFLSLKIAGVFN